MTRDRRWLEKATEWGTAHSDGETGGGQGLREKANSSAIDVNLKFPLNIQVEVSRW